MRARPATGGWAWMLTVLACTPDSVATDGLASESGDTSTGGDGDGDGDGGGDGDGDGDPSSQCGNGIVEPGEACEPNPTGCGECTDGCQLEPLLGNEWAIEAAPIVAWPPDPIEIGLDGTVVVRGEAMNGEALVLGVTPDGAVVHMVGEAEHGFTVILDHAIGPNGEVALLGLLDGLAHVVLVDAQGGVGSGWPVPDGTDQIAVTEHGVATLSPGALVHAYAFDGTPSWDSAEAWERLTGVDGRLLLGDAGFHLVEFVAGDGTDGLTRELYGVSRVASTQPVLLGGYGSGGFGEAVVTWADLWTGEWSQATLAVGAEGLEALPEVWPLDALPDGRPLAYWSVCDGSGRFFGCVGERVEGVGHPDDSHAVETHSCDQIASLRVAPDGGVYLLTQALDQRWLLVRRQTLE